jgi:hypothetical protein
MSQAGEIDLETGRIFVDGSWQGADELTEKLSQAIAGRNFDGVGRIGGALEQLSRAVEGARTLTVKVPGETFARIEQAAGASGKTTSRYLHDWLVQSTRAPPVPPPAPLPIGPPAMLTMAPPPMQPLTIGEVTAEEAAYATTLSPKRRESV